MLTVPIAEIAGWALVAVGVLLSLGAVADEIRLLRITEPYAGRRILPPEVHALAILMTGVGTLIAMNWKVGLAVFIAHGIISFAVITPILERKLRGP
jgi:hypothetical protein